MRHVVGIHRIETSSGTTIVCECFIGFIKQGRLCPMIRF